MANGGKITYDIGFNVDKSGLNELKSQLDALAKTTPTDLMKLNPGVFKDARKDAQSALYYIKQDLKSVQTAFNDAFNPTTGLMNLQKLNTALNQIGADRLSKTFGMLGQKGQEAFYQMTKSALTTNMQLKQTNTLLNKMGTTLMNTLKWTLSSGLINRVVGSLQQTVGYVEHLDKSLNDIRIVTKKSADEMDDFAAKANKAAQSLGKATTDYTEASLIYYQQGLSDEEVKARAETTLKAANVTGQATKTVSEQLTSVWNGFKVNAEQTEEYVDKLAAVAAMSASNLEELSTGMSKVASAASNLGVDIDQLTAQISTIVSVTRQAPESVGTALKTIYARISDLKLGDSDEDGLKLGDVSGGLQKLGIEILDSEGELRDLGTVIEEVAGKWDSWTSAQQAAIAQLMAGKRQYNNLVSLFSNWDMYEKAINTSRNATGELQKQQDIYMESTEAHLQALKTQWEDLYDSILDTDAINTYADTLTGIVELLTNFIDGIGGGRNALLLLGSTLTRVFSKQISQGITNVILGLSRIKENAAQLKAQIDNIQLFKQTQQYQEVPAVKALVQAQEKISKYYNILSNEQINEANAIAIQVGDAAQLQTQWENNVKALKEYAKEMQNQQGNKRYSYGPNQSADLSSENILDSKKALEALQNAFDKSKQQADDFSDSVKNLSKIYTTNITKTKDFKKNIGEITQSAKSAKDNFDLLNKQGLLKDISSSKIAEIEKSLNKLQNVKGPDDFNKAMQTLLTNLEGVDPAIKQAILGFEKLTAEGKQNFLEGANKYLDEFLKKANLQQVTNNIVNSIGAIGQFAGSINSLKNSFDVLGDSSLSAGEKITQFISSAAIGITMLLSSGSRLIAGYKSLNAAMNALNMAKITQSLKNKQLLKEEGALTVAGAKLIGVQYSDVAATDAQNIAKLKQIAIQRTLNPLLLASTGIIIGLTAVITTSIAKYKEMRENVKETAQATIEANKEQEEAISKRKEEVNTLQDLIDQYKQGKISIQEFNDKKLELIGTIDDISESIATQADNWREAQRQLDQYYADLAQKDKQIKIDNKNAGLKQALADMDDGTGGLSSIDKEGNYYYNNNVVGQVSSEEQNSEYYKALKALNVVQTGPEGTLIKFTITPDEKGMTTLQQIFDIQEKFKESAKDSTVYEYINEIYQKYQKSEGKKAVDEAIEGIKQDEIQEAISTAELNLQNTTDGLREQKEVFLRALKESSLTEEEKIQAWKDYLTKSTNKAAKELIKEENNLTRMLSGYAYAPEGGTVEDSQAYQRAYQLQQDLLNKGFTADQIGKLSSEDWREILFNGLSSDDMVKEGSVKIREAIQKSLKAGFNDFKEQVGGVENNLQTIIASAISGNVDTGEDSPYAKTLDYLDTLKQYYPELSDEVATFTNTGIIGTEKWINSAYTLQKAFSDLELSKKSDDLNDKIEDLANRFKEGYDDRGFELGIVPDTEEFTEAINEIMDEDYNITIEVGADIEDSFNNLVDGMEKADSMAAKIGENFIVSAEDITEIADAFPGILEGYTDLGDGTIQLNQEIAKSAMDAANQAEIASTEELVTEIKNTNTKLQVKKNHYDNIVKIAAEAAKTEGNAEEEKSKIVKELQDIEKENQDILSQSKVDNAKAVADNSNENAEAVGTNWEEGYQKAADAAITEAQIAIENAKRIAEANRQAAQGGQVTQTAYGQGTNLVKGWSGGKQGVGGPIDTNSTQLREQGDLTNKEYFTQIQEEAQKQSDLLEKEINANSAMAAEAAARLGKSVTSNNAVGSIKEDSSKNKSGSEKEADRMDYLEREEDIYREINTELENIESTLGRIDKVASHSWGEDYQQTLKEQNKLLDQQIHKLEEKRDLQKGDLSTRRKQLEDVGVTFAEDGSVMTNAEQVLNELYAGYNTMVTKYNAMSASEQEAYKAQMETEKNRIDAIEKKIGEYESAYSEFQSTLDELLEKHYADIENEVNQFNNKINVELELSDARKEWNEFWKDVVADVSETDFGGQIAASLKQLKELIGLGSGGQGIVGKLTTHLSKITSEVWAQINSANNGGQDSMFGDDTKLSKETLQEFISKTMSAIQDAEKEVDNIAENYLKTLESAKDIIDAQVDGYETISKHIDHNVNMIKLLDPEDYDALDRQYQRQYENDLNLVKTQRASKEFWQEQMKVHQQMRDSYEKGSKQWETYNKAYKEAVDNYVNATEAFDKAMEDALDKAKEIADNAAEAAYKRLDRSLSSNLSLEVMEDEWKLLNDEADRYYDNVERYLNMEEYTNYLNDAANAIGLSAENQEKLNAFRDTELKKLKEKEKLTEYDIEESKARLEIMKAEMALEDAQRNKSNMRLRRDSQGNYTYQYTADEEAIEDAENGVVTAKKAWYEIVKKRWKDVSQYIIDISKNIVEYQKKYREAKDRGDEEAAAKYLQLIEHQQKDLQLMYSEAAKNQQDLFSGTAQYFANVENAEILPQSEATVRTMVTQWTEGDDSFMGAIQNGIDEINRIQQQYVDDTQRVFEEAGESYESLRDNGIDPTKDSLDALVESQGDLDDNLNQITEDLKDHSEALEEAVRGYEDLKDAAVDAIAEANRALETLAATAIDTKTKVNEAVTASQTAPGIGYNSVAPSSSSNSSSGSSTSGGGSSTGSGVRSFVVRESNTQDDVYEARLIPSDKPAGTPDMVSTSLKNIATFLYSKDLHTNSGNWTDIDKNKIPKFKTGGYTGSWGSTGKLAVLHEKELVLNSSDTKNLLSAIEILRALPFSALAKSIVDSSSNIASTFRSGVSMNGVNGAITNNDTKNMTINADFSGVQSADEIYQALIELENYGLQQSYSVAPNINNPY